MTNIIQSFTDGGVRVDITVDDLAANPREWSPWRIVTRNDAIGDETVLPDDLADHLAEVDAIGAVPVYKYEHGLVRYSAKPFADRWDSGQVGVAYITEAALDADFGGDLHSALASLDAELAEYTSWANGECLAFEASYGAEWESRCGYVGAIPLSEITEILGDRLDGGIVESLLASGLVSDR